MLYNALAIMLAVFIPIFILKEPIKEIIKNKKINKEIFKNYKFEIISYFLLVIGIITRCVGINLYPNALNVDEASAAYEAFSIGNYGIDRNGNFLPAYLIAWGSGQNALYSYLMIPFVKLFGINIITTRLPMAILGSISLFVWYYLLKDIKDKKFALVGLAFFVICPWHIMKSRWGLESNLLPDIILIAVYFMVKWLKNDNKKVYNFYISALLLGISAYAYSTSYLFLPFFVIPLLVYLFVKKKANLKQCIIFLLIVGIVSFPIILYVLINTFDLQQLNLGFCTIPKLASNRMKDETTIFSSNFIINSIKNFGNSIVLLLVQDDGLGWNSIQGYGMYYILSIPFAIIGLIFSFKDKNINNKIMNFWFIASFLLLLVFKEPNINRINVLIIPIIYYICIGINAIFYSNKIITSIISLVYVISFICFGIKYLKTDSNKFFVFENNVEDVISYIDKLDVEEVYFENSLKEQYIYLLYYTQYNPHDFINTVQYFNPEKLGFENVKGFGKYKFYLPESLEYNDNIAYVIKKDNNNFNIDYSKCKITEFNRFVVIERRYI